MKFYKDLIKENLKRIGINLSLNKNLWYLDPFKLMKNSIISEEPIIFDIGAGEGNISMDFKKIFPKSKIYAFEPFPESFNKLEKTSTNLNNVFPFNLALSNTIGDTIFYVNKSNATNSLLPTKITNSFIDNHTISKHTIYVKNTTVDDFVRKHSINNIDILKLDVQGGEKLVFEGAFNVLSHGMVKLIYSEIWFIEGYKGQPLYHDIASYLHQFGYIPFGVYNIHYRHDGHQLWGDALFYLENNKNDIL